MIRCPKCGVEVEGNVNFCPNCGFKVEVKITPELKEVIKKHRWSAFTNGVLVETGIMLFITAWVGWQFKELLDILIYRFRIPIPPDYQYLLIIPFLFVIIGIISLAFGIGKELYDRAKL